MKTSWSKALGRWATRPAIELDEAGAALFADAQAAARLRAYRSDPNVAALSIERTRDRLDGWGWLLLFAGLAYTTVNVQAFVAGDSQAWSLPWLTAWLVEPMVMGLMLDLLRGEQIANRHGMKAGGWVRFTRWAALGITYVMNTGRYWTLGEPRWIFVHSVPVVLVFLAAESLVQQRTVLTDVVDQLGAQAKETPLLALDGPESDEETDDLSDARTKKERAYEAFCDLVEEGRPVEDIQPSEVDDRAGVRRGTSRVPGRMQEFRDRYAQDMNGYIAGEEGLDGEEKERESLDALADH